MDDYKPTPRLRYVHRPNRPDPGPLLVLQQLWEREPGSHLFHTEWRDVPVEEDE